MRATDALIAGKEAIIWGYGDAGRSCAFAMRASGSRVAVSENDLERAIEAEMEEFYGLKGFDRYLATADIFLADTDTRSKGYITADHMAQMKNNAIVANIGHFDNAIDMAGLETTAGIKKTVIGPYVDRYLFPDLPERKGHGIIILAQGSPLKLECATGGPAFVMLCSIAYQALAQIDLKTNLNTTKYEKE